MCRLPLTFLFLSLLTAANATEEIAEPPAPDLRNIVVAGPYCGVYSLYACLDVFGEHPPMEELLTTEFIGSFKGSTAKELIIAAEKYGLHGECYGNMTRWQLFDAKEPMILHFRGSNDSNFNHYRNVSIFRGGYREWSAENPKP